MTVHERYSVSMFAFVDVCTFGFIKKTLTKLHFRPKKSMDLFASLFFGPGSPGLFLFREF